MCTKMCPNLDSNMIVGLMFFGTATVEEASAHCRCWKWHKGSQNDVNEGLCGPHATLNISST